ncbi:acyltransferase family protein [Eggerthellaceae bacterium zg-1084]|uniref:acyltransferase n=1 Tax=Berryella wangjianweii TaxID=2734634 RepID=UPI001554372D|nr:acyltransferase family protein [Berryella wangjianweii]NPD31459.1 acyltransferase family protein [Berryella wangjianweii]
MTDGVSQRTVAPGCAHGSSSIRASVPTEASDAAAGAAPRRSRVRLMFVDVLNAVACFAVIVLHTTFAVFSPAHSYSWLIADWWQSVFIYAVPIFFMISGMNLLGYRARQTTADFFKRRVVRTGGALLLGSAVSYLAFTLFPDFFWGTEEFRGGPNPIDFVKRVLSNGISGTYWFFYAIIYLYLITPLLSLAVGRRDLMRYLIGLTALAAIAPPLISFFGFNPAYGSVALGWPLFGSISLLYFLCGYYVRTYMPPLDRRGQMIAGGLIVASIAAIFASGLLANGWFGPEMPQSLQGGALTSINSPFCVVLALSLFKLFESLDPVFQRWGARAKAAVSLVSGLSLYVYLFHCTLVINGMGVWLPQPVLDALTRVPVVKAAIVFAITLSAVWGVRTVKNALMTQVKAARKG